MYLKREGGATGSGRFLEPQESQSILLVLEQLPHVRDRMARTSVLILCHVGNLIPQLVDFFSEPFFCPTYVIQHGATRYESQRLLIRLSSWEFEFYRPGDERPPVADRR